jgi:hypothetical protein
MPTEISNTLGIDSRCWKGRGHGPAVGGVQAEERRFVMKVPFSGNGVDGWDSPPGYIIGLLIISRALWHGATLGSHTSFLFMIVSDRQRSQ